MSCMRPRVSLPGARPTPRPFSAQRALCYSHGGLVPVHPGHAGAGAAAGLPKTGKRPVLLAARNAHKALLYAAALLDFDIQWLWPAPEASGGAVQLPGHAGGPAQGPANAGRAGDTALWRLRHQSPDYLGGVQDIAGLAAVCQGAGRPPAGGQRPRGLPALSARRQPPPHCTGGGHVLRFRPQDSAGPDRRGLPASRHRCPRAGRGNRPAIPSTSLAPPARLTSFCSRWTSATRCWPGITGPGWPGAVQRWKPCAKP